MGAARVKLDLPRRTRGLLEPMLAVNAIADTLLRGTRPPDRFLVAAWLPAMGLRRYRETSHPFVASEALKGRITIEGATTLALTLHPRCSLPAGCRLVLTDEAGKVHSFEGLGPSDTPTDTSAHADAVKRWPQGPVSLAGPTVRYEVEAAAPAASASAAVSAAHAWGAAFTVCGEKGMSAGKQRALLAAHAGDVGFALKGLTRGWTAAMDADLCQLARRACDRVTAVRNDEDGKGKKAKRAKKALDTPDMDLSDLCVASSSEALRFQALESVPVPQLRLRLQLLRAFNSLLGQCLPAFSFNATRPWTTGFKLRALSHCIFLGVKRGVLKSWLSATKCTTTSAPTLRLNNFKQTASETSGDDSLENGSIFVQTFEAFRSTPTAAFRNLVDPSNKKVFEVKFEGEEGIDAGGVYREGLTRIIESAFSTHFSLLVATPNQLASEGEGSNAFLPNTAHQSPRAMDMLEMLGRFMGLSLRHESCLPFDFPSVVWRRLLGQPTGFGDLTGFDLHAAELVSSVRHCHRSITPDGKSQAAITTEEDFATAFAGLTFTTTLLSGKTVELTADGASTPVTLASRGKWCELVERARTREFDRHIAAMRKGLGQVVPLRALALFTFDELETLVCGSAVIDIGVLKSHTEYSGYSATSETVRLFWKVFATLTDEERSQYVRFSWGRSRLPSEGQAWTHRHTLNRVGGGSSRALPNAHTCFFTTDLPEYATEEDMRWGLLTAIHYGGGLLQG